jgi:hypothetical protein
MRAAFLLILVSLASTLGWRWTHDAALCRYGRPECVACEPGDVGYVPLDRQCWSWEAPRTADPERCLVERPVRAGDAACQYTLPTDWTLNENGK